MSETERRERGSSLVVVSIDDPHHYSELSHQFMIDKLLTTDDFAAVLEKVNKSQLNLRFLP